MSRDLDPSEKPTFVSKYGVGERCEKCDAPDVTIRIWEAYGSPAKAVGGDTGPKNIVAALVICEGCGHGQTVARSDILAAA